MRSIRSDQTGVATVRPAFHRESLSLEARLVRRIVAAGARGCGFPRRLRDGAGPPDDLRRRAWEPRSAGRGPPRPLRAGRRRDGQPCRHDRRARRGKVENAALGGRPSGKILADVVFGARTTRSEPAVYVTLPPPGSPSEHQALPGGDRRRRATTASSRPTRRGSAGSCRSPTSPPRSSHCKQGARRRSTRSRTPMRSRICASSTRG